jgi:hypothetical protein
MRSRFLYLVLASLAVLSIHAVAQAPVPIPVHKLIPTKGDKSWSLFLACNPRWHHPDQAATLLDLRRRYMVFGETTGRTHAAVWFTTKEEPNTPLDIERMSEYCEKFGLVPSEETHIVVTTVHPDRWTAADPKIMLAFQDRSASVIQEKLSKLNDQIALRKLSQEDLDSEPWGRTWVEGLEPVCDWLDKFTWGIDVKAFQIEREGVRC